MADEFLGNIGLQYLGEQFVGNKIGGNILACLTEVWYITNILDASCHRMKRIVDASSRTNMSCFHVKNTHLILTGANTLTISVYEEAFVTLVIIIKKQIKLLVFHTQLKVTLIY